MMPQEVLKITPDLDMAERHLTLLFDGDGGDPVFTFQTFDDDKARKKTAMEEAAAKGEKYRDPLARLFHGTLEQHAGSLARLNRAGAGVFVTVNVTDGKGRRLENIVGIRALWQEDDGEGKPLPLEPHFIVESSPGKFHRYLMVDGLSVSDFRFAEESLVERFGSDPNAKDPARVLRLAGFFHLKNPAAPWMVRVVREDGGVPYSRNDIMRCFPPVMKKAAPPAAAGASPPMPGGGVAVGADTLRDLRSALLALRADDYQQWVRIGLALRTLGEPGRALWLEWSATSPKFDAAAASTKWDTFHPSQTGHEAVFAEAQRAGWVNPAQRARAPSPPAGGPAILDTGARVVDIQGENAARIAFEKRIGETEDFDQLVFVLGLEIERAGLREATREKLLKAVAKKAGISLSVLKSEVKGQGSGGDGGGGDPLADLPEYVGELNRLHAVVHLQGLTRIMTLGHCPVRNRPEIVFSARNDFVLRYENRQTRVDGDDISWGDAWLKHPARREYAYVVFAPGVMDADMPPDSFNLWRGWGIVPGSGGFCRKYLDMVRDVICSGDEEAYAYVLGYMAHMVQCPADLPGAALVLRSGQRTGKGTFVETLGVLVGAAHYVELTNTAHLTGQFAGHLANALLVFANEATWGGDKTHEGALKAMITDPNALLEQKHRDAGMVRNYKRLIVGTNNSFPIPRDMDDARFVVLDVSESRKEDHAYFAAIREELANGGYEALMHYLMFDVNIEGWHPRHIPHRLRLSGWDLKIKSADTMVQWYYDCLARGWMFTGEPDEPPYWPNEKGTDKVRGAYESWCKWRNIPYHKQITLASEFGKALAKWGLERHRATLPDGTRPWVYRFPSLSGARQVFGAAWGIPLEGWEW